MSLSKGSHQGILGLDYNLCPDCTCLCGWNDYPFYFGGAMTTDKTSEYPTSYHHSMTLREYFAAQAMQGILAGTLAPTVIWSQAALDVAKTAYNMADAMLQERNK